MTDVERQATAPEPKGRGFAKVLLLSGLFMALVQIHRSAGAVIANELASRNFSPNDIASVVSSMFLASAAAQLPMGLLLDRYGVRWTLSGLGMIAVAGIVLFAVTDSVFGLALGRFMIGVGHGGVIGGIYLLALAWVSPSRVATVTGAVVAVAGGVGGVMATAPLLAMVDSLGMKAAFLLIAAITLAVTLAFGMLVRDTPALAAGVRRTRESLRDSLSGLWETIRQRSLWPVFAMASCFALPFHAIGGLWSGPYLTEVYEFTKVQASVAVLYMVFAFHLGNLLYGPVERLFGTRKWTIAGGAFAMIAMLVVLAVFPELSPFAVVALLVLFCLCTPFYPVLAAQCREFVELGRAGRTIACVNFVGLTTVFVVQKFTGWLISATSQQGSPSSLGFRLVFLTIAAVLGVALLGYLRVREHPAR